MTCGGHLVGAGQNVGAPMGSQIVGWNGQCVICGGHCVATAGQCVTTLGHCVGIGHSVGAKSIDGGGGQAPTAGCIVAGIATASAAGASGIRCWQIAVNVWHGWHTVGWNTHTVIATATVGCGGHWVNFCGHCVTCGGHCVGVGQHVAGQLSPQSVMGGHFV